GNFSAYHILYRLKGSNGAFERRTVSSSHATLSNLTANTQYEILIAGLYNQEGDTFADTSEFSTLTILTQWCNNPASHTVDLNQSESRVGMPYGNNQDYNYTQQLFLASEMDGPLSINSIGIYFDYTKTLTKSNCTIYMANTTLENFNDSTPVLPIEQLTPVYEGTLVYNIGLNTFHLQSPFYYNGTDNLLIAIDDNSGQRTYIGDKFITHSTDQVMSLVYSSTNDNPDPYADTIRGSLSRSRFRNNMVFTGCPDNCDKAYVCVIPDNTERGRVTGQGLYDRGETITLHAYPYRGFRFMMWQDNNTDNPRDVIITQDTVFVAYFGTPQGIDDATSAGGCAIITRHLGLTVYGTQGQPVAVYDIMGRTIGQASASHADNLTFTVPQAGIYIVRIGEEKPVKLFIQ
ncbi:MAG: DUF6383 domain-containing protein, partial [Bacteroidales bacterium]|nr:DUF6383 domain-containing protein [Bacteroidales bacterium]